MPENRRSNEGTESDSPTEGTFSRHRDGGCVPIHIGRWTPLGAKEPSRNTALQSLSVSEEACAPAFTVLYAVDVGVAAWRMRSDNAYPESSVGTRMFLLACCTEVLNGQLCYAVE